jgi:hypothetical protein
VRVSLDGFANEAARTIYPGLTFDHYVYTFTGPTSGPLAPVNGVFTLVESAVTDDYTVRVDAFANAGDLSPAATGTSAAFTVVEGVAITVPVSLTPDAITGTGTFNYKITYPAVGVSVTSFTYAAYPGGSPNGLLSSGNGVADTTSISSGYYLVTAELIDANGRTAGKSDVVHIYKDMTTTLDWTFTAADFTAVLIEAADVSGLIAPVTDAPPNYVITPGPGNYIVDSITWKQGGVPYTSQFAPLTDYTAEIVLQANYGYKFVNGITPTTDAGAPGAGTISGNQAQNTLTFTVSFNRTDAWVISSQPYNAYYWDTNSNTVFAPEADGSFWYDSTWGSNSTIESAFWDNPLGVFGVFLPETTYTRTVTLKANPNYQLIWTTNVYDPNSSLGSVTVTDVGPGDSENTLTFEISYAQTGVSYAALSNAYNALALLPVNFAPSPNGDGSDVPSSDYWVTSTEWNDLFTAINTIEDWVRFGGSNNPANQVAVDNATADLIVATVPFTDAVTNGRWGTLAPTVANATKAKPTQYTAVSVDFTLTGPAASFNDADTTWRVYTLATGGIIHPSVTAAQNGAILTLTHATDIPTGIYYVTAQEYGKPETQRLGLTVNPWSPNGDATVINAWIAGETILTNSFSGTETINRIPGVAPAILTFYVPVLTDITSIVWSVNGVPASAGVYGSNDEYFDFNAQWRSDGNYKIGLLITKNGKEYSETITVTVN